MLNQIFMQVMDMSKVASFIIVLVILMRLLLKPFPKFVSYLLWSVVLFRLLCPVSFESVISLVPKMAPTSYYYSMAEETIILKQDANIYLNNELNANSNENIDGSNIENTNQESPVDNKVIYSYILKLAVSIGKYIWLIGLGVMLAYGMISYYRVKQKTSMSVYLYDNIYRIDEDVSPFVMGLIFPKIYLPHNLQKKEQEYIVLHERFHIKRRDHIVKIFSFLALAIHWFNPLVWIAFTLSSKDMEMSCDEAVIKRKGEGIKADYSASLLALAIGRRIVPTTSLAFGEGDTKDRIKNLAVWEMPNKKHLSIITTCVVIVIVCLLANPKMAFIRSETNTEEEKQLLQVNIEIEEHYITATGDPCNVYYVDENKVLWARGENVYGQLGQGTQDGEYYEEYVKVAEDVIHVDYSQKGFMIYLTEEYKLYGCGNSGTGALQQYDTFDWNRYSNTGQNGYGMDEPMLLMEDVIYARCGKDDVVALKEDSSVWTWGTMYVNGAWGTSDIKYIAKPEKILEDVILVTGGWFNHAALKEDGSLWTWGYNLTGNCGVKEKRVVSEPTKVAEDVLMVWTGTMQYNIDCFEDYSQYEGEYPRQFENTIIRKTDGSYLICGKDVGSEEKHIAPYYEMEEIFLICSEEFIPIQNLSVDISIFED